MGDKVLKGIAKRRSRISLAASSAATSSKLQITPRIARGMIAGWFSSISSRADIKKSSSGEYAWQLPRKRLAMRVLPVLGSFALML